MESIPGLHEMLDRGELLKALRAFKRGDFSIRMPLNLSGIDGEIAQAFNDVVELEEARSAEIARVMGKSEGAIKALQYRALAVLRKALVPAADTAGASPGGSVARNHA